MHRKIANVKDFFKTFFKIIVTTLFTLSKLNIVHLRQADSIYVVNLRIIFYEIAMSAGDEDNSIATEMKYALIVHLIPHYRSKAF